MTDPAKIETAMVLAAGLGTRMRPITETLPKPLVEVGGRTLIDRALDHLADAGVRKAVVNVHHLADQVEDHLSGRDTPGIVISEERDRLMDSAGGIVKALTELGSGAFFVFNADSFWIDAGQPNLARLALAWDPARMDILLMLADPAHSTGHSGRTDFTIDATGRLSRSGGAPDGLIYAGAAIVDARFLAGAAPEPHSLNLYFDRAIEAGRLSGLQLDGHWITVGTPEAIAAAEQVLKRERG